MTADDCKTPDGIKVEMPRELELDAYQKVRMECLKLAVMRTGNAEPLRAIDLAKEYESYVNCGFGLQELDPPRDDQVHFVPFTPPAPPSQSPT